MFNSKSLLRGSLATSSKIPGKSSISFLSLFVDGARHRVNLDQLFRMYLYCVCLCALDQLSVYIRAAVTAAAAASGIYPVTSARMCGGKNYN